jgi:hypothetical protein
VANSFLNSLTSFLDPKHPMRRIVAYLVLIVPLLALTVSLAWRAYFAPPEPEPAAPVLTAEERAKKQHVADFSLKVRPFVEAYCVECHSGKDAEAQLDLAAYPTLQSVAADPHRWALILERVKAGEMPPEDAKKQPAAAQSKPVVAWLETMRADEARRHAGDPGPVFARRLSNAEYDNTIRDLTGVDIRPTKEFPVDPANAAGFDNSGESLAVSPALVRKYLEAARHVAEHLVFKPDGLGFAPFPAVTEADRDNYAVSRVVDFYKARGVTVGAQFAHYMGQFPDYPAYFNALWRFQHRAALGTPDATLASLAQEGGLSLKYLGKLQEFLAQAGGTAGPVAAIQLRWRQLPSPAGGKAPPELAPRLGYLRDFIMELRPFVTKRFANLVPNDRIVAQGSQTVVLWKNQQYAANRMTYPTGMALETDMSYYAESDPAMLIPAAAEDRARYEESFKKFCAVFPDAFAVWERARMFLGDNSGEIANDLRGHRLLTAGFHSQMGYFRDDQPLRELLLDDAQNAELDRLWQELEFVADVPFRQFKEFVWFERGEPPSLMLDKVFDSFRSEDDSLLSEAKLQRLAETYYSHVEQTVVHAPAPGARGGRGGGTPLTYRAPPPGTVIGPPPAGMVEQKLTPEARQAVRDYFTDMNARIRELERVKQTAEPRQLDAMIEFAARAFRRPLAADERESLLDFYRELRDRQKLSHEDAIRDCVVSVLMSPTFSFRVAVPVVALTAPVGPAGPGLTASAGKIGPAVKIQPLTDHELASRLSYFLWASMPDAGLLARAAAGELHKPEVLAAEARRLSQDARVLRGLATEFGTNWLDVRRFGEHNAVDRTRFPEFTNELRAAMFDEPVRFLADLVRRDGPVTDLLYGRHTFVNAPLATFYGLPAPAATAEDGWARADGADELGRGGLLPMAVFLTKNAPGLRTSPVKRGHWVATKILGIHIPAPPPNVPAIPSDETKLGDLTLAQTLARHREDKSCASCHDKFDSFGLVFEGYGPVGERRALDLAERPVETAATFPDGSTGDGLAGLKTYLRAKAEDQFADNLCRKLAAYALGRTLILSDDLLVADMKAALAAKDGRFGALIETLVTSPQFLHKRAEPPPAALAQH